MKKKILLTNKKSKRIFIVILLILVALSWALVGLAYKSKIIKNLNEKSDKIINEINLTEKQKLEDFNHLYDTLTQGLPSLENLKAEFGFDFIANKPRYIEAIIKTKNDYEYFCVMSGILADIKSMHTMIVYPVYENYSLSCYNNANVLGTIGINAYADYWGRLLDEESQEKYSDDYFSFAYIDGDGKYYFNENAGVGYKNTQYNGYYIENINGISPDEFIKSNISYIPLNYDNIHNKIYRDILFFTESSEVGAEYEINLKNSLGNSISITAISNSINDFSILHGAVFDEKYANPAENEKSESGAISVPYYFYEDTENNILYAYISAIDSTCNEVIKEKLLKTEASSVIIDIRDNGGGFVYDFINYIYAPLYTDNVNFNYEYYTPATEVNKKNIFYESFVYGVYRDIAEPLKYANNEDLDPLMRKNETLKYVEKSVNIECIGERKSSINVYLLTSNRTASAADTFTSILKSKPNTTIIGTNTKGEGMGGSFVMDVLPESRLVFTYFPSVVFNVDGSNNSLVGTSPNIYVPERTNESHSLRNNLIADAYDQESVFFYENRLIWDNVLIKTFELIKTGENSK